VKRYSRAELVAFLRRLDALLTEPEVLEIVGGAAAVLKYGARAPTKDIDTWNRVPKAVQDAADAIAATGQGVPLAPAGVAEIPNDAELRFKTVSIGLKKLVVRVPDRYDLALSKTIRGYDNDLQVIREMHERKPFALDRLVTIFETEMDGMVTTDKRSLRLNVAVLVATLFGDQEGEKVALRWGVAVPRLKKR
jgi:Nucleotidyltransferase of unknown function (DUF6036)